MPGSEKAVLRWKFIIKSEYIKKEEIPQINNLTLQIKKPEKENKPKPKDSWMK